MTSKAAPAGWRERAACNGHDTERWFGRPTETARAVKICARCPVRTECLHECMQTERPTYRFGIWGGLTAAERRALPTGAQDMTITALRRLLDEIDRQGGPDAARNNRLRLSDEGTEQPMTTAPALPAVDVQLKADADVRLKTVPSEPATLPVGQLLAWGDAHTDPDIRDQAALAGLRQRHAADQELTAITAEAEQLEKRLAELRAREAELAPAKPKRKRGAYVRDYDTRTVRAWADANGVDCPRVGQIPKRVLDAWRASQGEGA
ncbi:WhiB family transcriptional regulator [Streptomyces sp. G1]|uniref:WhiB family transcriptional regulator n=1 Tax=Streptomyces sp. G1 TaxID=361572 RepID=UPI00202E236A|nr:WhiB family transcriptional regulator [Streptomyces sp. G1]MCM1974605.1 WhiB family transcriptional regulator [Streptomyces sp. G1]